MFDYIIVGQGIAGSMLSWLLLKAGQKIAVIDAYNPTSASHIASGITNPITGRRFVKTWMADELIPFAENTYRELEDVLSISFYHPLPIIKLFDSTRSQNDWSARCATQDYLPYLKNDKIVYLDKTKVKNNFGGFEINGGSKLDVPVFLNAYRQFLREKELLIEEDFSVADLVHEEAHISYKGLQAEKIIFCEGANAIGNSYFSYLPFQLAKGECLVVKIADFYADKIINGDVLIMPLASDEYYIGATHEWDFENSLPSEKGKEELLTGLSALLKIPFEVTIHKAAIRPTVKDRRPFIGLHPQYNNIGIFNGMGTKGISLAPYFANHFAHHLLKGSPLLTEVDIKRFAV
jgi:glycine oxidase